MLKIMVLKNLTGAQINPGAVIDCGTGNGMLVWWYMNASGSWVQTSTKPRTVEGVCEKFEELLSKIDPSKVHSAIHFNIFDESKLDDYTAEPFNTHVFRFIPDNYPYHSTGGQVTRVELYPNKEDFRYVFGNTNINSNAYLIDTSLLNEDREIAITDTINDDLEETFTEVYPCV